MRKLTVKNFSVIKDATLEFGKITVLIGPQASGKSLLCKLAYFLGRELLELAAQSILNDFAFERFEDLVRIQFIQRFAVHGGSVGSPLVEYSSGVYSIRATWQAAPIPEEIELIFSDSFKSHYVHLVSRMTFLRLDELPDKGIQQQTWTDLNSFVESGQILDTTYIPADRSLFSVTDVGISAIQSPSMDPLLRRFSAEISWGNRWIIGSPTAGDDALQQLHNEITDLAGGTVTLATGIPMFKTTGGRVLPLPLLSSGTQELLPLLNVLDRLATEQERWRGQTRPATPVERGFEQPERRKLIYLEEPEANIFPSTQNKLIRLFSWLANDEFWSFNWVITTHSPYTLSAFNNLILAGQLGQDKKLKKKIKIDEKYWIAPGGFQAYSMHDGKLESILSETGLINGEYLDSVSDTIGGEFGELLRLEYANQKVS